MKELEKLKNIRDETEKLNNVFEESKRKGELYNLVGATLQGYIEGMKAALNCKQFTKTI